MHKIILNIILIILLNFTAGCGKSDTLSKAKFVGNYLIQEISLGKQGIDSIENKYLVSIGSELTNKLKEISEVIKEKYEIKAYNGDISLGDGTATHHIIITDRHEDILGIRLKYDKKIDKFHILGFWTPKNVQ